MSELRFWCGSRVNGARERAPEPLCMLRVWMSGAGRAAHSPIQVTPFIFTDLSSSQPMKAAKSRVDAQVEERESEGVSGVLALRKVTCAPMAPPHVRRWMSELR